MPPTCSCCCSLAVTVDVASWPTIASSGISAMNPSSVFCFVLFCLHAILDSPAGAEVRNLSTQNVWREQ